jgi:hypothetical protein
MCIASWVLIIGAYELPEDKSQIAYPLLTAGILSYIYYGVRCALGCGSFLRLHRNRECYEESAEWRVYQVYCEELEQFEDRQWLDAMRKKL